MPLALRIDEEVVHGGDPHDRLIPVHGPDGLSDSGSQRRRVAGRADHQRLHVVYPGPLCSCGVERI